MLPSSIMTFMSFTQQPYAPKRLGGSGYGLLYGVLEALLRDGAKFCDSRNGHSLCLL